MTYQVSLLQYLIKNSSSTNISEIIVVDGGSKDESFKLVSDFNLSNDKDYVFIHFIVNNLPKGIIGLLLAVILAAAMSSTASELNALASTTTIDVYKRNIVRGRDETHYVKASKWLT